MMADKKYCELCGNTYLLTNHHIFYGRGIRKICDEYEELQITLCYNCHQHGKTGVHFNARFDEEVKKYAQRIFEEVYSRELFMKRFKKNYLEE